jgi:aspartate racemase
MKKIGIIGGAGVAASNKLLELLENTLTRNGTFRDCHHPEIILYQATQAPSRSLYLEGKGPSFVPHYVEIAKKLKTAGAEKLCMCCNTAHYALKEIESKSGISFIDLIKEVVKEAKRQRDTPQPRRIGLIAGDGCLKGRVYEKYFKEFFSEAEILYPNENLQREITRGICNTKNSCRFLPYSHPDRPRNIFNKVCEDLFECGANLIILGCTDIGVDFYQDNKNIIDSLDVLANSIVENWMNNKDSVSFFKQVAKNNAFKPSDTKLVNNQDTSDYDISLIMKYTNIDSDILDLGSGAGLIINKCYQKVKSITAVELFEKFTQFIAKHPKIKIYNMNLFDYVPEKGQTFDLVTIFGTLHYFNEEEAIRIYHKYYQYLKQGGKIIVRQQFGVNSDVNISGFSEELKKPYYAQYRHLEKEIRIIRETGFTDVEVSEIYPASFNKWDNTHYYAIVATK